MGTAKFEVKRKIIDIPTDVFINLSVMAAREGVNLKRYIEGILLDTVTKYHVNESPLRKAADLMYADYVNDKELTVFTAIDTDDFYETK